MVDLSEVKPKKPKVSISLSLDKENIDYLKSQVEKEEKEGITLSAVFDYLLADFVDKLKSAENSEGDQSEKEEN